MYLSPWYQRFRIDGKWTTSSRFMCNEYFLEIAKILPSVSKKVVLDLACNAGLVSFGLARLGAKVIGFDKNERYIDQAVYVMRKLPVPRVKFIIMDIEEVLLEAYNPDLVVMLSILYHLKDPAKMVAKLSALNLDFVASFRPNRCDEFLRMIVSGHNYVPAGKTNYGRKECFFFKKLKRHR